MTVILDDSANLYHQIQFDNEKDFESTVVALADQIFGPDTIYIDVKKHVKGNDIVTIPDGYLIDMTDADVPRLFVVENEIVSHDPFQHIGVQMLKFVTSFDEAQHSIRTFLMDHIARDKKKLARLEEGCAKSTSRNIDNYLDQAVYGPFRGLVVIDEAKNELHRVLEKIYANISVLELRRFVSDADTRLYQFDTLYDEYDEDAMQPGPEDATGRPTVSRETREARRARRAASDTIVVPARAGGFKETFLGENRWYAIRIGAAMKERIKYIAAYQVAPISAVTHIAEVQEIRPYQDTGKYVVVFKEPPMEIGPIPIGEKRYGPQGPVYVQREKLEGAKFLDEALRQSSSTRVLRIE